jgi:poly(hydroxyalkanoate) depolymerase family esterase
MFRIRSVRGLIALACAVAAVAVIPIVSSSAAQAASLQQVTGFGTNPSNLQMYVYRPDGLPAHPALVVAVHYCTGSGPAFYSGTQFASLADRYKYIVIYPSSTNADKCFDVSSPAALKRNGGSDPVGIMSMVTYAEQNYGVDTSRIYATGASSGAMMTNVLLGDYPDVFKAGAAFAGVPYTCFATGSASNRWNSDCAGGKITKTAQTWGDLVRANNPGYNGPWPRVQLWHGTADTTLSYNNFGEEIKQWTNVNGLSQTPTRTDVPSSGETRTQYANAAGTVLVEGHSLAGVTHDLPVNAASAIAFFGLDGTSTGGQSSVEVVGAPSGRCVDVPNASTTNGTQVQLYDCSGSTQQLWTNTSSKQLQVYGNKCLDAYAKGTTNGTAVVIWDCNSGTNQQWNVNSNGTITGVQSGLCLDANAKGTANGTKLILWACNGGTNQQWSLKS